MAAAGLLGHRRRRGARGSTRAVTTCYVVVTGLVVAGLTLLGRWVVRLLAAPEFFAAHEALPWVALGWALYGLFLVFVVDRRPRAGHDAQLPGRARGPRRQRRAARPLVGPLGIAGAGIALCGAYVVMLAVLLRC